MGGVNGAARGREPREETRVQGPLTASECLLSLLMAPDEESGWYAPVVGKTRIQKELFLLVQETPPGRAGAFGIHFEPADYGPFSREVASALDESISSEVVRQTGSGPAQVFSLGDQGRLLSVRLWKSRLTSETQSAFFSVKKNYNNWSLRALLAYVYSTYPKFTESSLIRDEVIQQSP